MTTGSQVKEHKEDPDSECDLEGLLGTEGRENKEEVSLAEMQLEERVWPPTHFRQVTTSTGN